MKIIMKRCSKCKAEKPFTEFHKCISFRDGYHLRCIKCRSVDAKVYNRKKTCALYYQRNKGKFYARKAAVAKYGAARKFRCSVFGCTLRATSLHHVNYDKPLDVIPLCKDHHYDSHKLIGDK